MTRPAMWMVALLVLATLARQVLAQGTTTNETSHILLLEQVRVILRCNASPPRELKPSLDLAIASFAGGDLGRSDDAVAKLAVALMEGAGTIAESEAMFDGVHIDTYASYAAPKDPVFLASVARFRLMRLMLEKARATHDDAESSRFARASLLLAAFEDFILGASFVQGLGGDLDGFIKRAHLDHQQAVDLRQLVDGIESRGSRSLAMLGPAQFARDQMLKLKPGAPVPSQLLDPAIAYFDAAWAAAGVDRGRQFIAIQEVWMLRNVAVHLRSDATVQAIDQLLGEWRPSGDLLLRRWLQEACTVSAAPPTAPTVVGFKGDTDPEIKRWWKKLATPPKARRSTTMSATPP